MKKRMHIVMLAWAAILIIACGGAESGAAPSETTPINDGIPRTVVITNSFIGELNYQDPQHHTHDIVKDPATDEDFIVFYDAGLDAYIALEITVLQKNHIDAFQSVASYLDGDLESISEVVDPYTKAAMDAWADSGYSEVFYEGGVSGYLY